MKKLLFAICVIFLALAVLPSAAHAQNFTISSFHSDITVNKDSSIMVRETIVVDFTVSQHGIYREIPCRFKDDQGNTVKTPIRVLSVTNQAGGRWNYRVSRTGNVISIRIGDAKKYVKGVQTYVVTYKVQNAVLFLEDHDELYWNVTGNYWKAPIREASAVVNLAVKGDSNKLAAACYTGAYGAQEQGGFETAGNSGSFYTQRPLKTGEGLTLVFGWDKGLVSPPPPIAALNLQENWVFIFPVFSLAFMTVLWFRRGRDPQVREAVAVMYEPPRYKDVPLTPAETGALVDEKIDPRDITSSIVGLAVKGYIRIEELKRDGFLFDSTDYRLTRVKEPDAGLSAFENILMDRLFSGMPDILVSDLKNSFYKNLTVLKDTLYNQLVNKKFFLRNPESVTKFYVIMAVLSGVLAMLTGGALQNLFNSYVSTQNFAAGVLTFLSVAAFARAMPAKTAAGAAAHMGILGFREFLNRAEKDKIERMGDKDLFSKYLPYAIALDVADRWSKAFKEIYQEQPDWYVMPAGPRMFNPVIFSSALTSMASDLGSAMFSAPRGSGGGFGGGGFGGGGFSGGGFGGGGGGSW